MSTILNRIKRRIAYSSAGDVAAAANAISEHVQDVREGLMTPEQLARIVLCDWLDDDSGYDLILEEQEEW